MNPITCSYYSVRTFIKVLFLTALLPFVVRAEELIPGLLSFEPPAFLARFGPTSDAYDNMFSGVQPVAQYLANDSYQTLRNLTINERMVGFTLGEGKKITYRKLDEKALRDEFVACFRSLPNTTNISSAIDTKLGGQKAISLSFQTPRGNGKGYYEVYWI